MHEVGKMLVRMGVCSTIDACVEKMVARDAWAESGEVEGSSGDGTGKEDNSVPLPVSSEQG